MKSLKLTKAEREVLNMPTAENISSDICVSILSEQQGFTFTKVIRKYTLRDRIAGPAGGYKLDHDDKYINYDCQFDEACLKAITLYGTIYTTIRNYIDPPILLLTDLKEIQT